MRRSDLDNVQQPPGASSRSSGGPICKYENLQAAASEHCLIPRPLVYNPHALADGQADARPAFGGPREMTLAPIVVQNFLC